MRNLILNKTLAVPTIFFFLLCIKGGDLAAWVMGNTNLATWLEENKLGITFSGSDFSLLPAIAVIAGMCSFSLLIQFVIEMAFDVFDAFTATPVVTEAAEEKSTKPVINLAEKQEPTVTLPTTESGEDKEKR